MDIRQLTFIDIVIHPNFVNWFSDYLSFLSFGMLRDALRQNKRGSRSPIFSLSFRKHVNYRLSLLGIQPLSFWGNMFKSNAFLHGSFLLSCILDPLLVRDSKIFTSTSDIDIILPRVTQDQPCIACMRKLYNKIKKKDEGSEEEVPLRLIKSYLNLDLVSLKHRYDRIGGLLTKNQLDNYVETRDLIDHLSHPYTSHISMYLCTNGSLTSLDSDSYYHFGNNRKWTTSFGTGVKVDETIVKIYFKEEMIHFMNNHVDFDIGKVLYDGKKLTISYLDALLTRRCNFPSIDVMRSKIRRTHGRETLEQIEGRLKVRVESLHNRAIYYKTKGIDIVFSKSQLEYIKKQTLTD